jgi:pyruvate-formate lyase
MGAILVSQRRCQTMDKDIFETDVYADKSVDLRPEWEGFKPNVWNKSIDVRDFIQQNYTPYVGDGSFLRGTTERTDRLWAQVKALMQKEREKGVLDTDTALPSGITAHAASYQKNAVKPCTLGQGCKAQTVLSSQTCDKIAV